MRVVPSASCLASSRVQETEGGEGAPRLGKEQGLSLLGGDTVHQCTLTSAFGSALNISIGKARNLIEQPVGDRSYQRVAAVPASKVGHWVENNA